MISFICTAMPLGKRTVYIKRKRLVVVVLVHSGFRASISLHIQDDGAIRRFLNEVSYISLPAVR